ncbi:hypothetical protein [Leptospira adleri]|uniref:TIGR04452 family lipoprotein n=1 Tax=Leptospira adleri TaxID=2023186 RepID=A0A2M9YRG0_9LEPT|nr:hypothetical protein [Leptospira adleri]PJZ54133.1 hypothetical protein CH380_06375 [Leptospira adleri]PJZ62687.1 hypothetical protein CH376_06825 [Leptospira adleri]TGM53018.1 hypothetical protein EHQ97_14000 [Leptospira adleri]
MKSRRRFIKLVVLFAIVASTLSFCSVYYRLEDKDTMTSAEASAEINMAAFFAVVALPSSLAHSRSILTLPLMTIAAGLPEPKVDEAIAPSLYFKTDVKRCADSIFSSILLTDNLDSGLIAAGSCKLKKL